MDDVSIPASVALNAMRDFLKKKRVRHLGTQRRGENAQNGRMGAIKGKKIVVSTRNDREMGGPQAKVGNEDRGTKRESKGE